MKNKKLVKQVFTFGWGQLHHDRYHVIYAETKQKCTEVMFYRFGTKWSMQYDNEKQAGVKEFNLIQLS